MTTSLLPSGGGTLTVTAEFEDYYATGSNMPYKVNSGGSLSYVTGIEGVGTMETMEANFEDNTF